MKGYSEGVVDSIDLMKFFAKTHEKVRRLHITMDQMFIVNELQAREDLVCNHQNSF